MSKLIYLNSDNSSHHTYKRVKYFQKNFNSVIVFGHNNSNNTTSELLNNFENFSSGKRLYLLRLFSSFKIVFQNRKLLRKEILIVRGMEFLLPLKVLGINFYYEFTDIPKYFEKNWIKNFFKLIIGKNHVVLTSLGFNEFLDFSEDKILIFHNMPDYKNYTPKKTNDLTKLLYAGYLRSFEKIINQFSENIRIDFYGKMNIENVNYKNAYLQKNYKGEYNHYEIKKIYDGYLLSYISDLHDLNLNYNLTNRLYESILNYSLPVEIGNGFQKHFLKINNIFFVSSLSDLNKLDSFSEKQILNILKSNKKNLIKAIERDHKILLEKIRNR